LYEKINEIASLEPEKINEYRSEISGYKINASDVEELEDELVTSLNRVFTGFKNGFGFILSANVIIIATAILSYLSLSNSQSMSDVQDTTKVALIVNLLCYIMILVGLVILYNSSELKKSKKY
jgi:hypothetical protein